ncbi:MAG: redoxin domain-containing protein [Actinobacteria bacterium]|nr:redoxin domain-containing protein [Actinomycetota bacterium]
MILGISYDSVEENKSFAEAEGFPFKLLSDPDRSVGELYGTKRPDDHEYAMAPRRFSYLIDPDGKIAKAYVVKDVVAHADEVLADLNELLRS